MRRQNIVSVLALSALSGSLFGGPLNPPGGVVAPTYKTLDEIEPRVPIGGVSTPGDADSMYRISSAGSYYVIGSMSIGPGRSFLEVSASNVTIDMNGFRITGQPGSLDGIVIAPGVENVRIINGTLADFDQDGVDAGSATAAHLSALTVVGAGASGFRVGPAGVAVDCLAVDAGDAGFRLAGGATAERCVARGGAGTGFFATGPATISRCTARENAMSGFYITGGTSVDRCAALGNQGYGVEAIANATDSRVTDCSITGNTLGGVLAQVSGLIRGNTISGANANPLIRLMDSGNRVESNHTRGSGPAVALFGSSSNNFVLCNTHNSNGAGGNGFAGVSVANNVLGPVVTTNTGVSGANAWANFSR